MTKQDTPLTGDALIKEVCRRIRVARSYWDAHNNAACRGERDRALALYNTLTKEQKDRIPQVLRVWLRYRSEKLARIERRLRTQKPPPMNSNPMASPILALSLSLKVFC
ncbi:hypothetical protein [Nostoc sp.]|uniref:hypothetical protein n=1 Tax=Nostoc sp. TaxID=1180 RepID=UPI002FFC5C72